MMGRRILPECPALIQRAGPMAGPSARGARVQAQRRPWGPDAGFTLLEVLVALTILGLAVVTLIQLSSRSLLLVKTSADYQEAAQLADRMAMQSKPTDEGVDSGQEGPFQWERRISLVALPDELQPKQTIPGQEPPKLFTVAIAVRWGQNQALELTTLYTPTTPPAIPQAPPSAGQQPISRSTIGPATPGRQ